MSLSLSFYSSIAVLTSFHPLFLYSFIPLSYCNLIFPTSGRTLICLTKSTEVTSYSRPRLPYPLCYLKNYHQAAALITLLLFFFLVASCRWSCTGAPYIEPRQVLCSRCFATSAILLLRSRFNNWSFFLFLPCSFFRSPLHFREKVMQYTESEKKKGHLILRCVIPVVLVQ